MCPPPPSSSLRPRWPPSCPPSESSLTRHLKMRPPSPNGCSMPFFFLFTIFLTFILQILWHDYYYDDDDDRHINYHQLLIRTAAATVTTTHYHHTGHNQHQRVVMTRWWPLPQPCRLHHAPTSHYDLLVAFLTSPLTTSATTSTNESLWLVGCFFHLSIDHAGYNKHQWVLVTCWCLFFTSPSTTQDISGTNESLWLVGAFFTSPSTMQATTGTNELLRLVGAFFLFSLDHASRDEHQRAFMARWCLFFASPSIMQATTGTNESLRLVGAFFLFSLDHASHNEHQRAIKACWLLFSPLPWPSLQYHY